MEKPKKETTSAETWLKMDLEMQSGAIWKDEKSNCRKKKKKIKTYELPEEPNYIEFENGTYNGKPVISRINILRD